MMINEVRLSRVYVSTKVHHTYLAHDVFLKVWTVAKLLWTRRPVRLPELLLRQNLLTEILIWLSTSIAILINCGGMLFFEGAKKRMAIGVQERTAVMKGISRNLGIMIELMIFGCFFYLLATEYNSAKNSKGQVLLFRRGQAPSLQPNLDEESHLNDRVNTETLAGETRVPGTPAGIQKQTAVFPLE